MNADVGLPIQFGGSSRDETFLVCFDGFIKNPSEGIIRTMIRDEEDWILQYPNLDTFDEMPSDELYENTLLFFPLELLDVLADKKKTYEELKKDIETIQEEVILENSKITTFEFSLYNILKEKNIKKCYFFKEDEFTEEETEYLLQQYQEHISKIEFISGGFLSAYEETKPTTLFLNDPDYLFDCLVREKETLELSDKMFILLNTSRIINVSENNKVSMKPEIAELIDAYNNEYGLNVSTMYNFALISDKDEEEAEEQGLYDEEEDDYVEIEIEDEKSINDLQSLDED